MKNFEQEIINILTEMTSKIEEATATSDVIEIVSLLFVIVGGVFALLQWWKSNVYKRGEIVEKLISRVRNNEDIATVMDIIDWDKGFCYDGQMHVTSESYRKELKGISDSDLFKKIDETLSCFSYICYLKKQFTLTKKDMKNFEYEIRRLCDNKHIVNYLYSLYHWSASLNVSMSFSFLIDYCLKKHYILADFKNIRSSIYKQYLNLSNDYEERMYNKKKNLFIRLKNLLIQRKKLKEKNAETVDIRSLYN